MSFEAGWNGISWRATARGTVFAATALSCAIAASAVVARDLTIVTVGSATLAGTYRAVAGAICDQANASGPGDLRCSPETTPGSIYNLFAMRRGELDFALVQSDWQRNAVEGTGPFAETGPMEELRGVMSLYPEAVTLIARNDAGISSIGDIAGKAVDIGNPVTARRATNERLLAALDLSARDKSRFRELAGSAVSSEFCRGNVDAILLVLGHPNPSIASVLSDCDGAIVPIAGPAIEMLLSENTDYAPTVISEDDYSLLTEDIETYSVSATLVTRSDVPDRVVTYLMHAILENLPALQSSQRVLRDRSLSEMQVDGMTARLHPAAAAAFAQDETTVGQ